MARKIEEIESEILTMEAPVRAALAKRLLASLDNLSDEEIETLWLHESEARLQDFKAGRTAAISGDEVFERAHTRKS